MDELSLQHCTVGYIARQSEMPRWGQLGCNGLIVIDAAQQIVCPATTAFMQLRGLAFRHVEALLDALLEGEEKGEEGGVGGVARRAVMPKACPGEMVRLDTENPAMRGRVGVVMDTPGPMGVPLDERRSTVCLLGEGKGGRGGRGGQGGDAPPRQVRVLPEKLTVIGTQVRPLTQEDAARVEWARRALEGRGGGSGGSGSGSGSGGGSRALTGESKGGGCCGGGGGGGGGGCGSCACGDQSPSSSPSPSSSAVGKIRSVKVEEMDREHEECALALEGLARDRNAASLEVVLDVYRRHFNHEEVLLDTTIYAAAAARSSSSSSIGSGSGSGGNALGGFSVEGSMRKSHYGDHARLVKELEGELGVLRGKAAACGGGG